MKLRLFIISILLLLTKHSQAQFIDRFGLNIGLSYSNQLWDYKLISVDNSNQDYKIGFSAFLFYEKRINKLLSVRPEIGYIQKGFKNNIELTFSDGTSAGVDRQNVIFHDLASNIELKITPFDYKILPYISLGFRGAYMLSYEDVEFKEPNSGNKYHLYKSQIDKLKKINLGGLIGIGCEINDLTYLEIEYNPQITNSFNDKGLRIKDNCWGIKIRN